jgi:RNA polymerase sigma-70 factor (ECF subfamily)
MTTTPDEAARVFEQERGRLLGVAYRLTSSWADAEDVVADVWPRFAAHAAEIRSPAAWLTTVVSRAALDLLRSARVRREQYVGPWLPEPLLHDLDGRPLGSRTADPAELAELGDSVRLAFLVVLDRLSPEQRVAVVLHDALGVPFNQVAQVLDVTVEAARQHAVRGRRRLHEAALPPPGPVQEQLRVLGDLQEALVSGDPDRLASLLAPDVVLTADHAGRVTAAGRPLVGSEEVARFLAGLARIAEWDLVSFRWVLVNGQAGLVVHNRSAKPRTAAVAVYALTVHEGVVQAVHAVLAPDKVSRYLVLDGTAP